MGDGAEWMIVDYIKEDLRHLDRVLPGEVGRAKIKEIQETIANSKRWCVDLIDGPLQALEEEVDEYCLEDRVPAIGTDLVGLLHPQIMASSCRQFRSGHLRDAVLNSIVAVFDFLRQRTGLDKDGATLVAEAFSLDHPILEVADLTTESGRNEQKGFIQILQGVYLGVRNPKAHTLNNDLNEYKASQYLVLASLLARRIEEARKS
jgi:uncharacterized protein (TIGR02391 family)